MIRAQRIRVSIVLALGVLMFVAPVVANGEHQGGWVDPARPSIELAVAPTPACPPRTPTPTPIPLPIQETFEQSPSAWRVAQAVTGTGARVERSSTRVLAGRYAAYARTQGNLENAYLRVPINDRATDHTWEERNATWNWQQASVYLPAATLSRLGDGEYLTLAGVWPSSGGTFGWYVRVDRARQISVAGYTADGKLSTFSAYATFPTDQWTSLEIGLQSQAGPGIKRAFAFIIDGTFYGWYRQGHMAEETYNVVGFGVVSTTSNALQEVYIDQWRTLGRSAQPTGPDHRPTSAGYTHSFRNASGAMVQYDWSTWEFSPSLDRRWGIWSATNRLQAGHNAERMPVLDSGYAAIEIDWPNARKPPTKPNGYFGPMVGFRKEINREENLELIPIGYGDGRVDLVLEAWVGEPLILARWPLPLASDGVSHIPEPGDVIRATWRRLNSTQLEIRGNYYDYSASRWYKNVIMGNFNVAAIPDASPQNATVNFLDAFHTAVSFTIDSPDYSIRRISMGTLTGCP